MAGHPLGGLAKTPAEALIFATRRMRALCSSVMSAAIAVRRSRTVTSRYLVRCPDPDAATLTDPTAGFQGAATTLDPLRKGISALQTGCRQAIWPTSCR